MIWLLPNWQNFESYQDKFRHVPYSQWNPSCRDAPPNYLIFPEIICAVLHQSHPRLVSAVTAPPQRHVIKLWSLWPYGCRHLGETTPRVALLFIGLRSHGINFTISPAVLLKYTVRDDENGPRARRICHNGDNSLPSYLILQCSCTWTDYVRVKIIIGKSNGALGAF